jgi:hypothetical protein
VPVFCDQCGRALSDPTATSCPHCGAALTPAITPTPVPAPVVLDALPAPVPGRTARGPGARAWVRATIGRNVAGTLAGIIGAWFGVPMVLLMGGIGAIVGGLAGVVSGTLIGSAMLGRIDTLLGYVFPLPVKAGDLLPTAADQPFWRGIDLDLTGAQLIDWNLHRGHLQHASFPPTGR